MFSILLDMRTFNLERSKSPSHEDLKSPNAAPGATTSLTQRIRRFFGRSGPSPAPGDYEDALESQSQAYTFSEEASQMDPDLAAVADTDTDLINMTSPFTLLNEMDDIDNLDPEMDGIMEQENDDATQQRSRLIGQNDDDDEDIEMTAVGLRISKVDDDEDEQLDISKLVESSKSMIDRRSTRSKSFHEYSRVDSFSGIVSDDYIDFKRRASNSAFSNLGDFQIPSIPTSRKLLSGKSMKEGAMSVVQGNIDSFESTKEDTLDVTKVYFEEMPVDQEGEERSTVVESKRFSSRSNSAPGTPRSTLIHASSRRSESQLKVEGMLLVAGTKDDSVVDYRSRGFSELSQDLSQGRDKTTGIASIHTPLHLSLPDHIEKALLASSSNKDARSDSSGRKKIRKAHSSPEQLHRMDSNVTASTPWSTQRNNKPRALPPLAKVRSVGASLWPFMRSQVFLGMAASSVPIKTEVADFREELTKAGIRFVYFSPRNMRRSKSVAEKLGIQFDWNCAISLRALDEQEAHDPHRAISNYGDWDVHAKLPHGVAAIRRHLREIDNVPLLVSLYTDATPETVNEMVEVFQEYGEVVMTVGSAYRELNQPIFATSDVSVAVAMLPGDTKDVPVSIEEVVARFPASSSNTLTRHDLLLHFQLVSLGSIPLLQTQASNRSHISFSLSSQPKISSMSGDLRDNNKQQGYKQESTTSRPVSKSAHAASHRMASALETIQEDGPERPQDGADDEPAAHVGLLAPISDTSEVHPAVDNHVMDMQLDMFEDHRLENGKVVPQELQLSALLEGLRMGRVYLLNFVQAIAGLSVCAVGMALWPVIAMAIPISIPPYLTPIWALIFMILHIPILLLAMLNNEEHDHVMKNTPRKNKYVQRRDEERFVYYLAARAGYIGLSVFLVGWITSSTLLTSFNGKSWAQEMTSFNTVLSLTSGSTLNQPFIRQFWLLQDIMACELLLSMMAQLLTMQSRGQSWKSFPHPGSHPWFYMAMLVSFALQVITLVIKSRIRYVDSSLQDDGEGYQVYGLSIIDYRVWVSLFVLPIGGIFIGMLINVHDAKFYQRYMQFLRFDFETKLGQYSPR